MTPEATTESERPATTAALQGVVGRRSPRIRRKAAFYSVLGGLLLLGIWALIARYKPSEFELVPTPLEVAQRMWGLIFGNPDRGVEPGTVFINFWETLRQTLIGFVAAVVLGIPIGILMGRYRYAKNFFFDLIYLAANVPLIVYAIVSILLFGLGDTGPAFVVAILVLPDIALNVAAGVEGVDRGLLAMSRAYDRPPSAAVRHIVVPTFFPFLFAAARNSFASSWKLAALAETFGGTVGVGVQIRKAFQTFSVADMMAWMMFFVIFVVFIERVVLMRLERHVFRYRLKRGEDVLRF
jgi:NitT/TauT family transport system permease protein